MKQIRRTKRGAKPKQPKQIPLEEAELYLPMARKVLDSLGMPADWGEQEAWLLLVAAIAPHTMDTCRTLPSGAVEIGVVRNLWDPENENGQLFLHLLADEPELVVKAMGAIQNEIDKRSKSPEFAAIRFIYYNPDSSNMTCEQIAEQIRETYPSCNAKIVEHARGELNRLTRLHPRRPFTT